MREGAMMMGEMGPISLLKVTRQGQHRYGADADPGVLHGDAHWRNLVNTIE